MAADEADAYVHALARDWRTAPLPAPDRALCEYAVKLTLTPAHMGPADLDALRAQAALPAPELVAALQRALDDFDGALPQHDDITLLLAKRL